MSISGCSINYFVLILYALFEDIYMIVDLYLQYVHYLQRKYSLTSFNLLGHTAPAQAGSLLLLGPFLDYWLTSKRLDEFQFHFPSLVSIPTSVRNCIFLPAVNIPISSYYNLLISITSVCIFFSLHIMLITVFSSKDYRKILHILFDFSQSSQLVFCGNLSHDDLCKLRCPSFTHSVTPPLPTCHQNSCVSESLRVIVKGCKHCETKSHKITCNLWLFRRS